MDTNENTKPRKPRRRRSASEEASFLAELDRVRAMTVEERILEALSMGRRLSWLKPASLKK